MPRKAVVPYKSSIDFSGASTNKASVPFTFSTTNFSISWRYRSKAQGGGQSGSTSISTLASNEGIFSQLGSFIYGRQGTNDVQAYAYLNAPSDFAGLRRLRFRSFYYPIGDGLWHTRTLVFYVSSGSAKCDEYDDGVKVGSTHGVDYTGDATTPSGNFTIGAQGSSVPFNGWMARVRVYNRQLTANEVALDATDLLPYQPDAIWELNEGSGTVINDSTGLNAAGTLTGSAWSRVVPTVKRASLDDNLIYNGDLSINPVFVAAQTASGFIDGSAAGGAQVNDVFGWYAYMGGTHQAYMQGRVMRSTLTTGGASNFVDLVLDPHTHNDNVTSRNHFIPVQPNTTYLLSYTVKTGSSPAANSMGILWREYGVGTANTSSNISVFPSLPSTETVFTTTITTTAAAAYLAVGFANGPTFGLSNGVTGQWLEISNVILQRVYAIQRSRPRKFVSSLVFPGNLNGVVPTSLATIPTIGSPITMAAWVKKGTLTGSRDIMSLVGSSINTNIRWDSASTLKVTKSGGITIVAAPNLPRACEWVHVAFTFDGTTNTLYINGFPVATSTTAHNSGVLTGFNVGNGGSGSYFDGNIDSAMVASRALTGSEILGIVVNGIYPSSGIVLHYSFNEGAGTSATDSSGNGNTGTISGAAYSSDVPSKPRTAVGANLVNNGDFEYAPPFAAAQTTGFAYIDGTASGSATNKLFGWALKGGTGSFAVKFDSANPHFGASSLKISLLGTSAGIDVSRILSSATSSADIQNGVFDNVQPNTSYTFSFWAKTNYVSGDSNDGFYVEYRERSGSANTVVLNVSAKVKTTTGWTLYTYTFTTAATTRVMEITPKIVGNTGTATLIMDAWIDDIDLRPTANTARTAVS